VRTGCIRNDHAVTRIECRNGMVEHHHDLWVLPMLVLSGRSSWRRRPAVPCNCILADPCPCTCIGRLRLPPALIPTATPTHNPNP